MGSSYLSLEADLEGAILQSTTAVDYYLETAAPRWRGAGAYGKPCLSELQAIFRADMAHSFWRSFASEPSGALFPEVYTACTQYWLYLLCSALSPSDCQHDLVIIAVPCCAVYASPCCSCCALPFCASCTLMPAACYMQASLGLHDTIPPAKIMPPVSCIKRAKRCPRTQPLQVCVTQHPCALVACCLRICTSRTVHYLMFFTSFRGTLADLCPSCAIV